MASQIPTTVKTPLSVAGTAPVRGKKRPGSPAVPQTAGSSSSSSSSSKKKKGPPITTTQTKVTSTEALSEVKGPESVDGGPAATESTAKPPPFKDHTFMHSGIGGAAAGKKNRTWKNLKQLLVLERTLPWKFDDPNYYNIDAPPSLKPAKKYSDISGLPANYTDPQTKLRFTSSDEFSYIRLLPSDVVTGYLTLRKATCIVP